jgi:hypothetical protein
MIAKELKANLLGLNSTEDIHEAWNILKVRHRQLQENMIVDFSIGEKVTFEGRRGNTVTGIITKLNQKSVEVKEDGNFGMKWKVSPSMLKRV